jgi:DNA (cytosine-5)-methyltransferase 1
VGEKFEVSRAGRPCGLGNPSGLGWGEWWPEPGRSERAPEAGGTRFWDRFDIIPCRDGKARRIEPGTFPLAHGIPGRVGLLRGYGNAIVPELAAEFIRAYEESKGGVIS